MRGRAVILAAALILAPLGARAADLVVWWEEGYYAQEDAAVRETVAAFERETGKQVELVFYPAGGASGADRGGAGGGPAARLCLRLPRLTRTSQNGPSTIGSWTSRAPSATFRTCSIRTRLPGSRCSTRRRGRGRSTRCPWGARPTTSTSGRASWSRRGSRSRISPESGTRSGHSGATRCSRPCAGPRAATTSGASGFRCRPKPPTLANQFVQFMAAYEADYVTPDGRLVIDDPQVRRRLVEGPRPLHGDLSQGLHPARFDHLGQHRQQRAVPCPSGSHDAERHALDRQRAQARAPRGLL